MSVELKKLVDRFYGCPTDKAIVALIQDIVARAQMDSIFVAKIMEYDNE